MDGWDAVEKLNSLVQLNWDMARVYEQAVDLVDLPSVRERLARFRDEHQSSALDMSAEAYALGGVTPDALQSALGLATEGLRSVPERAEDEEVLKTLEADEQIAARRYRAARDWELPPSTADLIRRQHEAEEGHLQFLREEIGKRIWVM